MRGNNYQNFLLISLRFTKAVLLASCAPDCGSCSSWRITAIESEGRSDLMDGRITASSRRLAIWWRRRRVFVLIRRNDIFLLGHLHILNATSAQNDVVCRVDIYCSGILKTDSYVKMASIKQ